MADIDWDADDVEQQIMTASEISDMEAATIQLLDTVQCINRWVDDHPEHEQLSVWSRELLEAALYIQGEYAFSRAELPTLAGEDTNADPRFLQSR
ncbi:hypothetical protein ACFFQF_32235 [Haladaptatus pallidirubidus]|uniref:Uncharacterized protein n=1 Tax=Haladaptatus pallidirubidus TaxID=1008152 RepID=A0AAV3UMT8_9EURY|nr:hypothetical protein [Haladaptatus pallidirubidus]